MSDQTLPSIRLLPGQRVYVEAPEGQPIFATKRQGDVAYVKVTAGGTWVEPDPEPEPEPEPTGHLLGVDLSRLPNSGPAWTTLMSWADRTDVTNLSDQDSKGDVVALAKALVWARTKDVAYREGCIALLQVAKGSEDDPGDALGVVRGVAPIAIAANIVGYRDPSWSAWLAGMRTWVISADRDYTIVRAQEARPNNWGTHASASRIAIDLYLGDEPDLARAVKVFAGYLGDRSSYAGFIYGDDLSWQADPSKPVGVNPKGATKSGIDIDGVIPDDKRRGGAFPQMGQAGIDYTWEGLQGVLLSAILLDATGFPVTEWSDHAVRRAYEAAIRLGGKPTGDDTWQPWAMRYLYGIPASGATSPGKAFGFTDWLYGSL